MNKIFTENHNKKDHSKDIILNFVQDDTVFIHGIFDESISRHVVPQLYKLIDQESKKKDGKIIFDISSFGGYSQYLMHLLGIIEKAKRDGIVVETRVLSYAFSCGSMLACSGTKGSRFISESTEHLCHLGSGGTFVTNDIELERQTEFVQAHFDFVRNTYKKYASIPDLKKVIKDDSLFVRGQKIIDWGLADKIY
jgi:ATP-dependent protease ClpP protease subunit